ncbi:MAG TPA: Do family serine endopeptidase [Acidobacteriota bacterium]|jgi:serine protease Do|nr:Do family serine endopeptidase [Acidobacteriota bacterium]
MERKKWSEIIQERRGLAFLMLLLTLAIGIAIGTVIQRGASAKAKPDIQQLKISGEGQPLGLDNPISLQEGFSKVAQTVGPAVVNINTKQIITAASSRKRGQRGESPDFGDDLFDRFFGAIPDMDRVQRGLGSGVIVDGSGYILTNHHVINKVNKITVHLKSGEEFSGRVVGDDPDADLAIVRIDTKKPLPFAKVGDADKLKVGDWVLAIGSPFGLDQTVTAGIISATHRTVDTAEGTNPFGDYLQTDAAINMGNSGGPLVNMRGEVVGINSFITSQTGGNLGVGFAIPSTVFVNTYNQLISKGKIERGWLGVTMNLGPFTPEMAKYFGVSARDSSGYGVLITQLVDEQGAPSKTAGPAAKAGIHEEDVIMEFDGKPIRNSFDLRSAVANTPPGKTVLVKVIRFGEVKTFNVKLEERVYKVPGREESISTEERPEPRRDKEIGLVIRDLTPSQAQQLSIDEGGGALVEDVSAGSLADDAGLQPRMIIVKANGKQIKSAVQLKNLLSSLHSGEAVILKVIVPPIANREQRSQLTVFYTSFTKP